MDDTKTPGVSGTYVGGSISGSNIAVGAHSRVQSGISPANEEQISRLLEQLQAAVESSALPDRTKAAIRTQAVPDLSTASKDKLEQGLGKLNQILDISGVAEKEITTVGHIAKMIAEYGGIAFSAAAPFLSKLFGA